MTTPTLDAQRRSSSLKRQRHHRRPTSLQLNSPQSTNVEPAARPRTRFQGKKLCKRCRRIDLDSIFNKKHLTQAGNPVRELGPTAKWSVDSCPLCELLANAFGALRTAQSDRNHLRSFFSNRITKRGWNSVNTAMLSIRPGSDVFLVRQPEADCPVRILKPLISPELVREWLDFCRENHTQTCGSSGDLAALASISSFRLIDCETRRIVPASDQPYIALSYVWGKNSGQAPVFSDVLPERVSNTIEDALAVTRMLGFRYLWVDRHCINQQVAAELAEQCPRMNLIYNNSQLTIVAAAGDGSEYGLPGIRPRAPSQAHGKIGKHFLVSTMEDPMSLIKKSKWITRGWTYQEGVLSRRRLVFTDQQVYFECSGMYCCEALNFRLPDLHTQDGQRFRSCFGNGASMGIFPRKLGHTAWEVVQRIEEYSTRSLTNPADILNGFMGILQAFSQSRLQIRHCLGVPVLPRPPRPVGLGQRIEGEAKELYELYQWSSTVGFCLGLCWNVQAPSERRTGFPSWSWTGWVGSIQWAINDWSWRTTQGDTDLRVRVQLRDGRLLTWDEFEQSASPDVLPPLHISAWVTPIQILRPWQTGSNPVEYGARICAADGRRLHWSFTPTTNLPLSSFARYMAIHIARGLQGRSGLFVIVVSEVGPGIYERVGFGEMMRSNLDDPNDKAPKPLWCFDQTPPEVAKSWQEFRLR